MDGNFPTILHLRWNLSSTEWFRFGHQEHMHHGNPVRNNSDFMFLLMRHESGSVREQIDSLISSYIRTIAI